MLKRFRKLPQRRKRIVIGAVIAYAIAGVAGGCGAYHRPPSLSADERALLRNGPLPYSVTVASWDEETKTGQNSDAYNGALARLVTASGTFKSARYERTPVPVGQDLVATSTGLYCNSAVIPALSIISLGIIPTIFEDEHCEGMLLRRAAGRPKTEGVKIEVRYKGTVVMGWAAVALGAFPGWSWGEMSRDSRFVERFRLAVIRRRADIDRLTGH